MVQYQLHVAVVEELDGLEVKTNQLMESKTLLNLIDLIKFSFVPQEDPNRTLR